MRPYFEKMPVFGTPLSEGIKKSAGDNAAQMQDVEKELAAEIEKVKFAGFPEEKINARGQLTIWQRLQYLVDPGSWCPLNTLYNPEDNVEGNTNVFNGLGIHLSAAPDDPSAHH